MQNLSLSCLLRPNFRILVILNLYFFIRCYGMPMYSDPAEDDDEEDESRKTGTSWTNVLGIVVAAAFVVSLVLTVTMCICCRVRRKEPVIRSPMPNGIQSPVFQEVTGTSTEFTIFPPAGGHVLVDQKACDNVTFDPLPDIHPRRQNQPSTNQKPRPATFSNIVGKGRSLEDWFEDPYSNFPRKQLQYVRELGSGWFGQVVEGEACSIVAGQKKSKVVVKILMEGANTTDQMCFLHEVKPFRHLNHPNVLKLLGKCLEGDPFLVILEYCAFKDLKSYLIRHRTEAESLLQQDLLLRMSCNVAAGLQHLHDKGFILTDLAARNCLVASDLNVKVGDYGNSIELYKEDYFCAGGVAVPVRWCAPETLRCTDTIMETREVTQEANIWSFGVVIWEILEFGKLPYIELSDDELIQRVVIDRTEKLKQPLTPCRHVSRLYQIIQLCQQQPNHRPTMDKLHNMLTYLYANRNLNGDTSSEFEARWHQMQPAPRRRSSSPPARKLSATQSLLGLDFGPPVTLAMSTALNDSSSYHMDRNNDSGHEMSPSPHPSLSCDSDFSRPAVSPSMQNLRGSLEDLSSELELGWNSTATTASFSRGDSVASISGGDSLRVGATLAKKVAATTEDQQRLARNRTNHHDGLSSSSLEVSAHAISKRSAGDSEKEVSPFTREVEDVIRRLDEDLDRECPSLADATSEIIADEHALSEGEDDQTSALSDEQPPDSLNLIIDSFPSQLVPSHRFSTRHHNDDNSDSSSCGSDDDSSWKRIVETSCQESGEVTRIIREKSQSVQDFLKLTVIDSESGSDSDGLPSLQTCEPGKKAGGGVSNSGGNSSSSALSPKPLQVRSASLGDVPKEVAVAWEVPRVGGSVLRAGQAAISNSDKVSAASVGGVGDGNADRWPGADSPSSQGATSLPHILSHDRVPPLSQLLLTSTTTALGSGPFPTQTGDSFGRGAALIAVEDRVNNEPSSLNFVSRVVNDALEQALGEVGSGQRQLNATVDARSEPLYQLDNDSDSDSGSRDVFSLERRRHRLLHGERLGSFALPSTFALKSRPLDSLSASSSTGSGFGGVRSRPVHSLLPEIVVEECASAVEDEENDEESQREPVYQMPKVELNFRFNFKNLDNDGDDAATSSGTEVAAAAATAAAPLAADQSSINSTSPTDDDVYVAVVEDEESLYGLYPVAIGSQTNGNSEFRGPLTSTPHRSTSSITPPRSTNSETDSDVFNADSSFMSDVAVLGGGRLAFDFRATVDDDQQQQQQEQQQAALSLLSAAATDDHADSVAPGASRSLDNDLLDANDEVESARGAATTTDESSSLHIMADSVTEPSEEQSPVATDTVTVGRDEEMLETGYHSSPPTASDSGTTETLMTHPVSSPCNLPDCTSASSINNNNDNNAIRPPMSLLSKMDDLVSSSVSVFSLGSGSDIAAKSGEDAGSYSLDEGFEASGEDYDAEDISVRAGSVESPLLATARTPPSSTTDVPPPRNLVPLVPQLTISDEMGGDAITYDNSSVTSSNEDDCILMVDLETNEAVLVDGHRPKSRLDFATHDATMSNSDDDDENDMAEIDFVVGGSTVVNSDSVYRQPVDDLPVVYAAADSDDLVTRHEGEQQQQQQLLPTDDWNDIGLDNWQPQESSPCSAAGEAGSADEESSPRFRERGRRRQPRDVDAVLSSSSTTSPLSLISSSSQSNATTEPSEEESPISSASSSSRLRSSTSSLSDESSVSSGERDSGECRAVSAEISSASSSTVSPVSLKVDSDLDGIAATTAVCKLTQGGGGGSETANNELDADNELISIENANAPLTNDKFVVEKVSCAENVADVPQPFNDVDATPCQAKSRDTGDDVPTVDRPQMLSVNTSAEPEVVAAVLPVKTTSHQVAIQNKSAPLSPDWDVVSGASSLSSSSCQSPSSSSSMSGEFDCSKEFQFESRQQDQNEDPHTANSEQSESSCPTGYTIVEEDEAEYGDDEGGEEEDCEKPEEIDEEDEDEETSRSFTASVWDKDAVPIRGVLRSPDRRYRFEGKKTVSFTFPKNTIIYEYPKEEYDEEEYEDEQNDRQMWSYHVYDPQLDYSSYEDWELGNEEIPEDIVEMDDGGSSESSAEFVAPAKSKSSSGASLYRLSDIPDEEVYGGSSSGNDDDHSYMSHGDSFDFATYLAHFNGGNPFYATSAAASGGVDDHGSLDPASTLDGNGEDFWLKTILNSSDFLVSGSDCPFEFNVGSLETSEDLPRWAVSPAAYNAYVDLQGAIESHQKEDAMEDEEEYEMDDFDRGADEDDCEEDQDVVLDYLHDGDDENMVNGQSADPEDDPDYGRGVLRRTPDTWDESDGESTTPELEEQHQQQTPADMETDSADELVACQNGSGDGGRETAVNGVVCNGDSALPVSANAREVVKNILIIGGGGGDDADVDRGEVFVRTKLSNGDDRVSSTTDHRPTNDGVQLPRVIENT